MQNCQIWQNRVNDEELYWTGQLKDLEWRLDQEAKAYYKADEKCKQLHKDAGRKTTNVNIWNILPVLIKNQSESANYFGSEK